MIVTRIHCEGDWCNAESMAVGNVRKMRAHLRKMGWGFVKDAKTGGYKDLCEKCHYLLHPKEDVGI